MNNIINKARRSSVILCLALVLATMPAVIEAQLSNAITTGMNELGPENSWMSARVGAWDVTETVWASPGATPTSASKNLIAERKMVGSFLQEIIRSAPGLETSVVQRMDYLSFNRGEGRWKYVSMDTRVPVGIMPAASYERDDKEHITLRFDPFTLPGSGQMLRMEQFIIQQDANRDRKDQYFIKADGSGKRWLAHRYDYVRRNSPRVTDIAVPPAGASSRIDEIRKRGLLRVAVLDEYPWLKQTTNGDVGSPFEGPAWLLATEYAKRLGVKLETVPVNFDNKVSVLTNDQVDITIAPLLVTAERAKLVDLISYSMSAQSLFGRADNPKIAQAKSIDDLNRPDITIAYIKGSPQGTWLQKRLPKAVTLEVPGSLADVPVGEIVSRRADVTTIDKFFFTGLMQKSPGLMSIPRSYMESQELPIPIGMAIGKQQPVFLTWLQAVAEAVKPQVEAEEARVEKTGS